MCLVRYGKFGQKGVWHLKKSENSCVGDDNSIPFCHESDLDLDVLASALSQRTELWVIILSSGHSLTLSLIALV